MSIVASSSGSFKNTNSFLDSIIKGDIRGRVESLAQEGVVALSAATPQDSGLTAQSWSYEVEEDNGVVTVWWINTNTVDGFNVAVGLQYGHATGNGGWIEGYDYINEALQPIFDKLADSVWKEVQSA